MIATAAIAILVLYLLIGEPLLGRASHRRMLATVAAGARAARRRFYLQWIGLGWALLAITLLVTLGLAGWTPAMLGLRLPYWPHLPSFADASTGFVPGVIAGAVAAAIIGVMLGIIAKRKARRASGTHATERAHGLDRNRNLAGMLPHTTAERRTWIGLACTAGISEEIIWRGFGLGLLFMLLPGMHPALPIALSALAFGWAHLYQGAAGVIATALLGAALATLYWASGSLLWPIVIHVLLDLPPAWQARNPVPAQGGTP